MPFLSKTVYINKLDDIVDKYNSTYHRIIKIKMKPVDVKSNTYIDSSKLMIKILNLKLALLLEYQNMKTFLQKVTLQIGLKKILWLKKLKILCRGPLLLMILMEKKLAEFFTKKNCRKQIKRSLELKK